MTPIEQAQRVLQGYLDSDRLYPHRTLDQLNTILSDAVGQGADFRKALQAAYTAGFLRSDNGKDEDFDGWLQGVHLQVKRLIRAAQAAGWRAEIPAVSMDDVQEAATQLVELRAQVSSLSQDNSNLRAELAEANGDLDHKMEKIAELRAQLDDAPNIEELVQGALMQATDPNRPKELPAASLMIREALDEAASEALTNALHPEFGTEWQEPDGRVYQAVREARREGARSFWNQATGKMNELMNSWEQ